MTKSNKFFDEVLLGRKSIRVYDTDTKISQEELQGILKEANTAPSSLNIQPIRFVVVQTTEGKNKITPLFQRNVSQCTTSAAMIFIFGDLQGIENIEKIMQGNVQYGNMTEAKKVAQVTGVTALYNQFSDEQILNKVTFDGGLTAMNLMLAARNHGYDTCAIGGFDKEQINEVLGLDKKRYVPLLAVSIGKAAETGYDSYRLPISDITEWL